MEDFITRFRFKYSLMIIGLSMFTIGITSCSKDDVPEKVTPSEKKITGFVFLLTENPIDINVIGQIDEGAKTITANMPEGTDVNGLIPSIEVSTGATVSPTTAQNFNNPVTYTVTGSDGSTTNYTATVSGEVTPGEKKITGFVFLLTENPIDVNVIGQIDEGAKTITAIVPEGTDVNGLIPEIEVSPGATVSPVIAQDFTNPVTYTVTAENGSTTTYTATVTAPLSQRDILQIILDENPDNTLGWDLPNTADLGDLSRVTTDFSGNIIELNFFEKGLTKCVPEIGQLTSLIKLNFATCDISFLPPEIGQLVNLELLYTPGNRLSALPEEISDLVKLERLFVGGNQLTSIPIEITTLNNLKELDFGFNQITSIPVEIAALINLKELKLTGNQITSIPAEIGNLIKLERLELFINQIASLPPELGFLTELITLDIAENNLTSIPLSVCLLAAHNGLSIINDVGVSCANPTEMDALISIYAANPNNTLGWGVDNYPEVTISSEGIVGTITANNKNLVRIPGGIDAMTSLKVLNLNGNSFGAPGALTADIGNIISLTTITLANTGINTVPASFGNLSNLTLLLLTSNPITSIPQEVCDLQISSGNGGNLTIITDPGEGCD